MGGGDVGGGGGRGISERDDSKTARQLERCVLLINKGKNI